MTYIIAEISGNHGGHLEKALELIEAAAGAGADYAKFQLYKPEDLPDFDAKLNFPVPTDWLRPMFDLADALHIELFASVFAPWAVWELAKFQPPYYKIASPESTLLPDYESIVNEIRRTNIPVIWSAGKDSRIADKYYQPHHDFMLYCKQGYPAIIDTEDFYFIRTCQGFSDHTVGIVFSLAAVGAGAQFIEKHFKLDDDCIDAAFSIDRGELKALCDLCS